MTATLTLRGLQEYARRPLNLVLLVAISIVGDRLLMRRRAAARPDAGAAASSEPQPSARP